MMKMSPSLQFCFCSFFLVALTIRGCDSSEYTVIVDVEEGDDDLCMSAVEMVKEDVNSYPVPCASLNYAVRGNVSQAKVSVENCSDETSILVNVTILLRSGVYQLTEQLALAQSKNITFQADTGAEPVIKCVAFPNVIDFDNILGCQVDGLTFQGITFTECGPISSNVFIHTSSNINIDSCVFKNNSGTNFQTRFTTMINVVNTVFRNNTNNASATTQNDETTIEDLYRRVQTSGGMTIFLSDQKTDILIDNCTFEYNRASVNLPNDSRPVLLKQNGHGGAFLIRLNSTQNSTVKILNSRFLNNYAQVDGGGVYISYSDKAESNVFTFSNLTFESNTVEQAAGGAISVNSFGLTFNNTFLLEDCHFYDNKGSAGGGFSMALYESNLDSTERPDSIQFTRCNFISNSAINEGTAIGLFSLVHVDQVGFPVKFEDCTFLNNTSTEGKDTSAVAAFRFPTEFSGNNTFINNVGGGIMLLNTRMLASGTLLFERNRAMFGGGIMMDDRCLLELARNVNMTFVNNYASESGGGIYVEFPPIRFVIDIFNRLCFLQYNDGTGSDLPPQNWTGVSIQFINNTARLSGAAIYASDMQRCSWLGNDHADLENAVIFKPPAYINVTTPFKFEGNSLDIEVGNDSVRDSDLATAPLNIHPSVKFLHVQPGERLAITLNATDQLNNTREAIWALDSSQQDTTLDALSADNDTYFYTVPSASDEITGVNNTDDITLNFSLLKTLGLPSNLTLSIDLDCHPGFSRSNSSECECLTDDSNILRCDDDNRYIYLREGIWGSTDSTGKLITARVLPGFTNCTQQGRLPGCLYMFDQPDQQCVEGRGSALCGQCNEDYGVTLDLQSCVKISDQAGCIVGVVLFVALSCIGLFVICFLILWFNIPIPNELKAFIFYAQVIGLVYRPYSVVTDQTTGVHVISVIVNLLGFSNPLPVCVYEKLGAEYVALFGYIPPFIIVLTIIGFAIGARFIKQFAQHSALKGITTLSIFFYKYIADTSFVFLSCVQTDLGFVFQYDGNVKCFTPYFGIFFFIALLTVVLFVFPLPLFVSYVCHKRPQNFQAYADVLTDGLKDRHLWWGGWDIARRIPFVFCSFFVAIARPSLILFFMSIAALIVMIVHVFIKPYKKEYINIIEAAILLDLLLVTGAFLDPSSEQVPDWFAYILVFLPYIYCIGYFCWLIGKRIKVFIDKRRPVKEIVHKDNIDKPDDVASDSSSDRNTGGSYNNTTAVTGDSINVARSGRKSNESLDSQERAKTGVKLREPLLEDDL